jgi:hypothetical protein
MKILEQKNKINPRISTKRVENLGVSTLDWLVAGINTRPLEKN